MLREALTSQTFRIGRNRRAQIKPVATSFMICGGTPPKGSGQFVPPSRNIKAEIGMRTAFAVAAP